jgi:hypothetical protein
MNKRTKTPPSASQKVKTSIAMPPALWRKLRIRALEEGRTAFSILEQLAAEYLARPIKKGGR